MNLSNLTKATSLSVLFSSLSVLSFAQGSGEASSSANSLVILLFTCVMVLVVFLAAIMGDKIIKLAAGKIRKDSDDKEFGLVPSLKELVFGTQNTGQSKKKITLYNLNHYRDFITMKDISKIIFCLYNIKFKGIINIATGRAVYLKDIATHICKHYKKKVEFKDNVKKTYLVANIDKLKKIYKKNLVKSLDKMIF